MFELRPFVFLGMKLYQMKHKLSSCTKRDAFISDGNANTGAN